MSKQIVYHGSYCKVDVPKIVQGKYTKEVTKNKKQHKRKG